MCVVMCLRYKHTLAHSNTHRKISGKLLARILSSAALIIAGNVLTVLSPGTTINALGIVSLNRYLLNKSVNNIWTIGFQMIIFVFMRPRIVSSCYNNYITKKLTF